jgi:hypothetical protein
MIACALRTEIQLFCAAASDGLPEADLARCALAAHRLTHGRAVDTAEAALPSARALTLLVERSVKEAPAAFLAYQALSEYLVAQLGLEGGSFDRVEEALDAIDDLVQDPADLPVLRESLRRFTLHFEQLCHEVTRAPRRLSEHHVSAA